MDKYKVCVAQTTSYKDGKEYNIERAEGMIKEAAANGAALIVFPELYLTGYVASRRLPDLCEEATGPSFEKMASFAAENKIHIVYGFPEYRPEDAPADAPVSGSGKRFALKPDGCPVIYNSVNFISDKGELIGTYSKTHLFAGETINCTAGTETKIFDTDLGRVGLIICFDLEFPEPARMLGARDADLIIAPSANMGAFYAPHDHFAKCRAMENCSYVVYSNYVGSDNRFTYVGKSGVYAPDGALQGCEPDDAECLIYADIDLEQSRNINEVIDYVKLISDEERDFYLR